MNGTLISTKCQASARATLFLCNNPIAGQHSDEPPARTDQDRTHRPIIEPSKLDEFRENVEDFLTNLREVLERLGR
jgi:hypothetical protein